MNWEHIERAFGLVDKYGLSLFIALTAVFMVVRGVPRLIDAVSKKLDTVSETIDKNFKAGNQAAHEDREDHYGRMSELVGKSQQTYLNAQAEFHKTSIEAHRGVMERKDQERREMMAEHAAALSAKDLKIYELYDRLSERKEADNVNGSKNQTP